MIKPIIIAIDGYSSCGKSTLAKALAKQLNFSFVDTGAMYRAVTLYFLRNDVNWNVASEQELNSLLDKIHITFKFNKEKASSETFLNGECVEDEIRGKQVSNAVSEVAKLKTIRKRMVELQQRGGTEKALVLDGRDIGTKVFPNAELKLFMTADPEIRARRRFKELQLKGEELTLEEIKENLKKRDFNDSNREENPLRQAEDAIVLDNSNMNQEEQLDLVMSILKERGVIS